MNNYLNFLTINKGIIFKGVIAALIVIALIILIIFIRKHKILATLLGLTVLLTVGFYFLNSSFAFHFTNDLTRDTLISDYSVDKYNEISFKDKNFYVTKAYDEDGNFISDEGKVYAVEKKLFYFVELKPKKYLYSYQGSLFNGEEVTIEVKEFKYDDGYFYSFKVLYTSENTTGNENTITKYFLKKITINDETITLNNLYFTQSEDKLLTLRIDNIDAKKI